MAGWWCTDLLSRPTEFLGCTSLIFHIPTDFLVAQEASDVESSLRLDFLLLHNLRRRFAA